MIEKRPNYNTSRSTPPGTIRVNGRNVRYDGSQNPKAIALWLRERRFRSPSDIRDRMRSDIAERVRKLGRVVSRTPTPIYTAPAAGWMLDIQ